MIWFLAAVNVRSGEKKKLNMIFWKFMATSATLSKMCFGKSSSGVAKLDTPRKSLVCFCFILWWRIVDFLLLYSVIKYFVSKLESNYCDLMFYNSQVNPLWIENLFPFFGNNFIAFGFQVAFTFVITKKPNKRVSI